MTPPSQQRIRLCLCTRSLSDSPKLFLVNSEGRRDAPAVSPLLCDRPPSPHSCITCRAMWMSFHFVFVLCVYLLFRAEAGGDGCQLQSYSRRQSLLADPREHLSSSKPPLRPPPPAPDSSYDALDGATLDGRSVPLPVLVESARLLRVPVCACHWWNGCKGFWRV